MKRSLFIKLFEVGLYLSLVVILFLPSWWFNTSKANLLINYQTFGGLIFLYVNKLIYLHIASTILVAFFQYLFFPLKGIINKKIGNGIKLSNLYTFIRSDALPGRMFISTIFFKSIGLIFLIAFLSVFWQVELVTEGGLIPFKQFASITFNTEGIGSIFTYPSIFWINQSNWFIYLILTISILSSVFVILFKPKAILFFALWFFYLSIVTFGRDLFQFPWDTFLLEVGFLGCVLAFFITYKNQLPRYLLFVLLLLFFRQWLSMGMTKLLWSDPTWKDLTFMKFYWLNIPSPSPLGLVLYNLPLWFHKIMTLLSLLAEISIPFCMLFGRRGRRLAFFISLTVSVFIQLTGNFGFFNLLTIVLSVWCLDDQFFKTRIKLKSDEVLKKRSILSGVAQTFIALTIIFNLYYVVNLFIKQPNQASFNNYSLAESRERSVFNPNYCFFKIGKAFSRFRIVCPHGVFKSIPKERVQVEFSVKLGEEDGWHKLKAIKGKEVIDFSFSSPNMNRLQFNIFYQGYGVDFRPGQVELNPNTRYLDPWVKNLIQGILENNEVIGKLIEVPKRNVESVCVSRILYRSNDSNEVNMVKTLDSIIISKNDSFVTPLFKNKPLIFSEI